MIKCGFPKLFEPGRIGKLKIRNRIIMAPMVMGFMGRDGACTQREIDYLVARAKGGVGLIMTEGAKTEEELSKGLAFPTLGIHSDELIRGLFELVEAVHDCGAKIGLQINAGGGRNRMGASPENIPVSASAVPAFSNPNVLCRELSIEEIKRLVKAYHDVAKRAVIAGFDMIEFHAHGGYLEDQFMTPLWNRRSDEYGGDFMGRMKFVSELIGAVQAEVGPDFPLSFRFAAEHKMEGGRTLAESVEIAQYLESLGIDVLHIDAGCYETFPWMIPPTYLPRGCTVDLAAAVKQGVNIPVITAGNIDKPQLAEQILQKGKADFICLGRSLIADPCWANKAKEGRVEDIRPCIRCNEYCMGRLFSFKSVSCSTNPAVGKERYYKIERAEKPKKVMVVGGGPAGMEAARVAALRGHEVTLYEKDNELGGQARIASKPPFKGFLQDLINYLTVQLGKSGGKVETGKEVNLQLVDLVRPEVIVVATGATPLIPPIPGIENEKNITVVDLYLGKRKAGDTVIVAGGGLIGCEAALWLAQQGKEVTVVEMLPEVAYDLNAISRTALLQLLTENGVAILTNLTIEEFTLEGLVASDNEGKQQTLKADAIVLALGARSENELAKNLEDKVSELYVVGDCLSPRKIGEAIHEGFVAGYEI